MTLPVLGMAGDAKGNRRMEINTEYMLNLLADSGFGKLQDPETKKETFVRIEGNIVREITSKDIRSFLVSFVRERSTDIKVWNLVLNSSRAKITVMDDLPVLDIDFTACDAERQFLFFSNKAVEVTASGIVEHRLECPRYVWERSVSPHRFKRIDPAFTMERSETFDSYVISIRHTRSHYFRYLINSSRLYWREEMEARATGNDEEDRAYFERNHFTIEGARLSYEEVEEQMNNLVAKIFAIEYIMHRYKEMSKAWALWVMEDKVSEDGKSSGGSGKSFLIKFLSNFTKTITLGGRNRKLTENKHIFENVDEKTGIILTDDFDQYGDFKFFYDKITGPIEVDEKNVKSKMIDFEHSPKMAFTSNFPPRENDPSTARRLLFVVMSDWYHEKNDENDYRETRTINNDFGYDICFGRYSEEFWNEDINFLVDCIQFYLSADKRNVKLQPPMRKVYERMNISAMGNQFKDWAEVYFSRQGENLDKELVRADVMADFIGTTNSKNWATHKFTKALNAFCKNTDYIEEINPEKICNSGKRIVRNIAGKSTEMIYIKTYGTQVLSVPF